MKTRTYIICPLVFITVCGIFAFVGWTSGYNFDHRGSDVGFVVMMAMTFSIGAAVICGIVSEDAT